MGPNWRMWLKSWLVWLAIICFVYLYLASFFDTSAPRIEALWPWAWPWSGYIVFGSQLLALLVLGCILGYGGAYSVAASFLMLFEDKELNKRTAKAKEKYANGFMSVSTALCSATFIAVLLFPLTAFIQATTSGTKPVAPWVLQYLEHAPRWWVFYDFVLFVLFWLPLGVATWFRKRALALYDEIATLAPAVAPTVQGTHEQSTIPDSGPPAYVRANRGSRRRRRHRGT
jgi:hypothetical protein